MLDFKKITVMYMESPVLSSSFKYQVSKAE